MAPSWSWASIHGPIGKQFRFQPEEEKIISVVDIIVDPLSNERWGLSAPNLIISGFIRRVTIKDNLALDKMFPPTFDNKRELLIHQGPHQLTIADSTPRSVLDLISYSLESNIDSEKTDAYFLFLTWSKGREDSPTSELSGLLLDPTTEANTSKRIGTLRISSYGAIAAKYQVKKDVVDQVEAWNSFQGVVRSRNRDEAVAEDDAATQFSRLHLSESVTERLYDHDWTVDDSRMEILEPREIVLQ